MPESYIRECFRAHGGVQSVHRIAHCRARLRSVTRTIGANSLRPNTSEISTGQVMELPPPKSVFPNEKRVFARTSNSSNLLNGVQGVAGSNPAVPILPPHLRGQIVSPCFRRRRSLCSRLTVKSVPILQSHLRGENRFAVLSPTPLAVLAAYGQIPPSRFAPPEIRLAPRGRLSVNVLPFPRALSTVRSPSMARASWRLIARPNPVPPLARVSDASS